MDINTLTTWFKTHQRELPWREPGTTPWGVLVSEIMLQQTPVARVEPKWREWLELWPTPPDLAEASVADALRLWGTLGYPRRARNLHQTATIITQQFGGDIPRDVPVLLQFPGIGHYTARAVASFAFGDRHPVADTNVTRVIARVSEGAAFAGHWTLSENLSRVDDVLRDTPDEDFPQANLAMMELGALVCQARQPRCTECPLREHCRWRADGYPVDERVLPKKQARYQGSDRQARGALLAVLRETHHPVGRSELLSHHTPRPQAKRALDSLLADGLVQEIEHGEEPHLRLSGDSV